MARNKSEMASPEEEHAESLWADFVSSLVHALRYAREGVPRGAQTNLNNAIIFAARYTMVHQHGPVSPGHSQTALSELAEFAIGPANLEHTEFLLAYIAQPAMGNFRDALDDVIKERNMEPLSMDIDWLMDRSNEALAA